MKHRHQSPIWGGKLIPPSNIVGRIGNCHPAGGIAAGFPGESARRPHGPQGMSFGECREKSNTSPFGHEVGIRKAAASGSPKAGFYLAKIAATRACRSGSPGMECTTRSCRSWFGKLSWFFLPAEYRG